MRSVQTLVRPSIATFRDVAFQKASPAVIRGHFATCPATLPAIHKWFQIDSSCNLKRLNALYLRAFGQGHVPVEVTKSGDEADEFDIRSMPLSTFVDQTNAMVSSSSLVTGSTTRARGDQLYLAQCPVQLLHQSLQEDLPTPNFVLEAGHGDVYMSTVWLGLAPTYTSLHKDPNPNILAQLAGTKVVRLLEPAVGLSFYNEAQRQLHRSGNSAIRGSEMMAGEEKKVLESMVWNNDQHVAAEAMYEETVEVGDALFIPKGWWHSVKGVGTGMTGSVNWWFR